MTDPIWETTGVTGCLSMGDKRADVRFDLECDRTGNLLFSFAEQPVSEQNLWLSDALNAKGRYAEFLTLDGKDPEGNEIWTEFFHIKVLNRQYSGLSSSIRIGGETSWLEVKPPVDIQRSEGETAVQYRVVGMEGFGALRSECCLGRISIAANATVEDYDELTGILAIRATEQPQDLAAWADSCNKKVDKILEILSLAEDRRLDWSIREIFDKETRVSLLFVGPHSAPRPQHPVFSHLHLQPAVDLAVHRYTDHLREEVGMGLAIEYFLMRPRFLELQFIAAMTGLEHMLQQYASSQSAGGITPKEVFRKAVLPALRETIRKQLGEWNADADEEAIVSDPVIGLLTQRLGEINRTPQRDILFAFLHHYEVPMASISTQQVSDLVRVRNDLAHGRKYRRTPQAERLSDHLATLHELLRRVFLTLLGYSGDRWTFLNGQEWVAFPPTESGHDNDDAFYVPPRVKPHE